MSGLSSAVYTPPVNFGTPTQAPPAATDPIPGTRSGQAPNTQTSGDFGDFDDKQLEAYVVKPEDKAKPTKVLDYNPKPEDLAQVAETVAKHVKVDESLMTAALRGDAASMQQMLSDFGKQIIQQSVLASTSSAAAMTNLGADRALERADAQGTAANNRREVLKAATAMDERFNNPRTKEYLEERITALTEDYPSAPVDLIAKKAASEVFELIGRPAPKAAESGQWDAPAANNWAAEFGR